MLWAVVAWWLESWACNLKVAGSILALAGIEYHDWGALEQGIEPPIAPWALEQWLPTAPGVSSQCACSLLTAVCVHLDGLNAEHQFQVWVTNTSHYYYYYYYVRKHY